MTQFEPLFLNNNFFLGSDELSLHSIIIGNLFKSIRYKTNMIKIDSSSLIYCIKGNYYLLLKKIYQEIVIIDSVYEEVINQGKLRLKRDAFVIEKLIEQKIFERHPNSYTQLEINIGKGELEVIKAAQDEKCKALIDDQKARRFAIISGIDTLWTPLVFLDALKNKIITEKEFDSLFSDYNKVANPSIEECQLYQKMKELVK
jgi:predicted nucleic acid-binding protein